MKSFQRVQTTSADVQSLQANIINWIGQFAGSLIGGAHVTGVFLKNGTTTNVAHTLGRVPRGRIITRMSAPARVSDPGSGSPADRMWAMTTDADVTVDIWFF